MVADTTRRKKPAALVEAEGTHHATKLELAEQMAGEPHSDDTQAKCPAYLTGSKSRRRFRELAGELQRLKIWQSVDSEQLARYVDAEELYQQYTARIREVAASGDVDEMERIERLRDRVFKQAQSSADRLGMNVTSRCRIVIPKDEREQIDF